MKKKREKDILLDPNNQSEVGQMAKIYQAQKDKDTFLDKSNDPNFEYDEEQDLYVLKGTKIKKEENNE